MATQTWIGDARGNKCSVEYLATADMKRLAELEAAEQAA